MEVHPLGQQLQHPFSYIPSVPNFFFCRVGGAGLTTRIMVKPKILSFMVKVLKFHSSGRTNNCQVEVLFKWSDQSCTPSAALVVTVYPNLYNDFFKVSTPTFGMLSHLRLGPLFVFLQDLESHHD